MKQIAPDFMIDDLFTWIQALIQMVVSLYKLQKCYTKFLVKHHVKGTINKLLAIVQVYSFACKMTLFKLNYYISIRVAPLVVD